MKWISVKDKLPDYLDLIYVRRSNNEVYIGFRDHTNIHGERYSIIERDGASNKEKVTHWMKLVLPKPPKK